MGDGEDAGPLEGKADPTRVVRLVERWARAYFQHRSEGERREPVQITVEGTKVVARSAGWDRWQVHISASPELVEVYRWPAGEEARLDATVPFSADRLEAELEKAGRAAHPRWDRKDPDDLLREARWIEVAVDDLVRDRYEGQLGFDPLEKAYFLGSKPRGAFLDVEIRVSGRVVWVAHRHGRRVRRTVISQCVVLTGQVEADRGRLLEAIRPRRMARCKRPDRRSPTSTFVDEPQAEDRDAARPASERRDRHDRR